MQSQATRFVASVLMFPLLLVIKMLVLAVRGIGAILRFIVGVLLSCVETLKVVRYM